MSSTRRITGEVVFPAEAAATTAARITIELRDVSEQDRPSSVVASTVLDNVPVSAYHRVPFHFDAPIATSNRALSMRVQVDMTPASRHAPGDFLSTVSVPVNPQGDVNSLVVPVTRL